MFEKVNPSHPDKLADRIAGAIVDLAYKVQDDPKVAVEVLIGHGVCHAVIETSAPIEEVDVAKARGLAINPDCEINTYNMFIQQDNLHIIQELSPDYVIDAIDSVKSKLDLVQFCHENQIPIVSAMGTGNRFAVDGFVIDTVENTAGNGCGLSRVMRQELKKRGVKGHISLFNKYPPQSKAVNSSNGRHAPGSTVFAPNLAGIMIAQYVCDKLGE